jgi:hypothetical protein
MELIAGERAGEINKDKSSGALIPDLGLADTAEQGNNVFRKSFIELAG